MSEYSCTTACIEYANGDRRHATNCPHYKGSLSETLGDAEADFKKRLRVMQDDIKWHSEECADAMRECGEAIKRYKPVVEAAEAWEAHWGEHAYAMAWAFQGELKQAVDTYRRGATDD